jgi:hypothetical protein
MRSLLNIKMFMAASFCAYVRKLTTLDILPQLNYSNAQLQQGFFETIKSAAQMMNTKVLLNNTNQQSSSFGGLMTAKEDDMRSLQMYTDNGSKKENADEWRIYMPIFGDD